MKELKSFLVIQQPKMRHRYDYYILLFCVSATSAAAAIRAAKSYLSDSREFLKPRAVILEKNKPYYL